MSYKNTWLNNDGLEVPFGAMDVNNYKAGTVETDGMIKEMFMNVDISNLPTSGTAPQGNSIQIPSGSAILSVQLAASATFDVAMDVGTMDSAGVAISKNGLIAAATPIVDTVTSGTGTQVDTVMTKDVYLTVEADLGVPATTGAGRLLIRYMK